MTFKGSQVLTRALKLGRIREPGKLSSRAVALLVFLARSAGAGVVAAHFGTGPDRFWRLRLRRSGLQLQVFLLAALALFDLFRLILRFCGLHQEKEADGLLILRFCGLHQEKEADGL